MQTPAGDFYLHHDWLGSITDVTDATGVNHTRNAYDPYGVRVQTELLATAPQQPFAFTGQILDIDGVANRTYLRARTLDSPTGRFTTTDPIELRPAQPFTNDYNYADNAPTHLTDPTGLCTFKEALKAIAELDFGPDACDRADAARFGSNSNPAGSVASDVVAAIDEMLSRGRGAQIYADVTCFVDAGAWGTVKFFSVRGYIDAGGWLLHGDVDKVMDNLLSQAPSEAYSQSRKGLDYWSYGPLGTQKWDIRAAKATIKGITLTLAAPVVITATALDYAHTPPQWGGDPNWRPNDYAPVWTDNRLPLY